MAGREDRLVGSRVLFVVLQASLLKSELLLTGALGDMYMDSWCMTLVDAPT